MSIWAWVKNNIAAIVVPVVSGIIALIISYGANIAEETTMQNRLDTNELTISQIRTDFRNLESEFEDLEDLLRDKIRDTELLITSEGRELERSMIRMEARLENFSRRLAVIDGIGAPSFGFTPNPRSPMEEMTMPPTPEDTE